jgi:hypothetical protein
MGAAMSGDDAFTKIAGKLLTGVRDLVDWGIEEGHTTQEKLRLTVQARRETAARLIEGGMSQRQAAKALGVSHTQVQKDLATKLPNRGNKGVTNIRSRSADAARRTQPRKRRKPPLLATAE